jgi:hypothetical protein
MRVIPALLFVLPLLAGCAMFENDDDYNNINKLVGQSDSLLVKVLGQPTKRYDQDGHRFFAYDVHQLDTFDAHRVVGYQRRGNTCDG